MYLSRLILDPRSRQVRRDTGDCHQMHRTLCRAFPGTEGKDPRFRSRAGLLWRLDRREDGTLCVIAQSEAEPNWGFLQECPGYLLPSFPCPAVRSLDPLWSRLVAGTVWQFLLRANPTRKVATKSSPDGSKSNGRRLPLDTEEDELRWFLRKAAEGGFYLAPEGRQGEESRRLRVCRETPLKGSRGAQGDSHGMTFHAVRFEGYLQVTDGDRFREILKNGLGSAKAYGFGLLSLAPV